MNQATRSQPASGLSQFGERTIGAVSVKDTAIRCSVALPSSLTRGNVSMVGWPYMACGSMTSWWANGLENGAARRPDIGGAVDFPRYDVHPASARTTAGAVSGWQQYKQPARQSCA